MNKKTIITIILGTILLFIWNAISWMALPFHSDSLNVIPEGAIETEKLKSLMPESGVYHFPGMPTNDDATALKKVEEQLKNGPRITMMVYKNEPTTLWDPMIFLFSLIMNLITVVLTFYLISKLGFKDLKSILMAVMAIALLIILMVDLSQMNWFMFPMDYTFANVIDRIITFGILGLLFGLYTFKNNTPVEA